MKNLSLAICFLLASISLFAQDAKYPIEVQTWRNSPNEKRVSVSMHPSSSPYCLELIRLNEKGRVALCELDINKLSSIVSSLKEKYFTAAQRKALKDFPSTAFAVNVACIDIGKVYFVSFSMAENVFKLCTHEQWQKFYDALWDIIVESN